MVFVKEGVGDTLKCYGSSFPLRVFLACISQGSRFFLLPQVLFQPTKSGGARNRMLMILFGRLRSFTLSSSHCRAFLSLTA